MSDGWEILTLRGLASADERAEEFTGTLVISKKGSREPVDSITISAKRAVLVELHETLGRLLARSTAFKRPANR